MRRLADWWFEPAPAERLAALRIGIGLYALVYLVARLPELVTVATLPAATFDPIGLTRLASTPLPVAAVVAIAIVTCVALVGFTLGWAHRVVAPLAALGLLWTLSYRNSWGIVFHTENLVALHVLVLACSPAADAWALSHRSRGPAPAGYGWPLKLMSTIVIVTYVLAGVAKLRLAGASWIDGDQFRNQLAFDSLRKALLGGHVSVFARAMLDHRAVVAVFAVATLTLELGAPIALLGGRIAAAWVIAAWSFHVGVALLMNIWFPYPLLGFAFLPMFAVERPLRRAGARMRNVGRARPVETER